MPASGRNNLEVCKRLNSDIHDYVYDHHTCTFWHTVILSGTLDAVDHFITLKHVRPLKLDYVATTYCNHIGWMKPARKSWNPLRCQEHAGVMPGKGFGCCPLKRGSNVFHSAALLFSFGPWTFPMPCRSISQFAWTPGCRG